MRGDWTAPIAHPYPSTTSNHRAGLIEWGQAHSGVAKYSPNCPFSLAFADQMLEGRRATAGTCWTPNPGSLWILKLHEAPLGFGRRATERSRGWAAQGQDGHGNGASWMLSLGLLCS